MIAWHHFALTIVSYSNCNSLCCSCNLPTILSNYMTKTKTFFTSIASKIMSPYKNWQDNGDTNFSLQLNFLRPSILDKRVKMLRHFSQLNTNSLIIKPTPNAYSTKPQNYIFPTLSILILSLWLIYIQLTTPKLREFLEIMIPSNSMFASFLTMILHDRW